MATKEHPNGYWTKERTIKEAGKYDMVSHFKYGSPGAFCAAKNNGWLQEIKAAMRERFVYSFEELQAEADKYEYVQDFMKNSPNYYKAASKRGIVEIICKRLKKKGSLVRRQLYVFEFSDHCAYIGLSFNPDNRKSRHLRDIKSAVYKHVAKTVCKYNFKIVSDFMDKDKAAAEERRLIIEYRQKGWTVLNQREGGELGSPQGVSVSNEYIIERALQFDFLCDFRNEEMSLYVTALHRGLIPYIKTKIKTGWKRSVWNGERLSEVITSGMTRSHLKKNYPGAYVALRNLGLLPILFPGKGKNGKKGTSPAFDETKRDLLLDVV